MKRLRTFIVLLGVCLSASVFAQNVVSVQVGAADPVEYADFDVAWTYAMNQQSATITLLADIIRTQTINYRPTVADGRHIFDLNNHTITENTTDRLLVVNRDDAKLTITDSSPAQGGCLYKQMESDVNIYTVTVYQGEIEVSGGRLYCENTIDDPIEDNWHPAVALHSNGSNGAVVRVSGGMVESISKATAYAISSYSTLYITGGYMRATVTKYKNSRAVSQQMGTANISGGTFEALATGTGIASCAVSASSWIGATPETAQNGNVIITGGTFIAETETNNAYVARTEANVEQKGSEIVTAHGTMHISGGTFIARAPDPSATQIFAAVSNGTRLLDTDATDITTPHHIIGESLGELTISGGDFLVDTRDAEGKYVENGGNIDLLRNWGTLNVSGGTFTIYQNHGGTGIGCYRNKVTVTGNPIFNIHGAYNTRGVVAGPWNHANYCDVDASTNKAEIEIYGGTFNVVSDSVQGNTIAAWAYGGLSTASASGDAGYAMQATVTIHDGLFIAVHPNANYSYVFRQENTKTGAYGTAVAKMIVYDGKFQALGGTPAEPTTNGRNITSVLELAYLAGGYYVNYTQLATHLNDNCKITRLTTSDPEYAEGYRYKVELGDPVAKLTVGADEHVYSSFMRPFNHAQKHAEATISLLDDIDYIGETMYYNAAPADASTTLDLNGHTLMVNGLLTTFCIVDKDNTTFTIKDSGTGGVFGNTTALSYGYLLVLRKGKVILESGTLFSQNTAAGMYGIHVQANGTNNALLEIKGGKIHTVSNGNTYTILAKSTSSAASLVTISGGEVEASSSGNYAFALTVNAGGKITITGNPKIAATNAISETQAVRAEASGEFDIRGGRFWAAKGRIVHRFTDDGILAIRGGYYNEQSGEIFRKQVETYCVPPYHTFPTTSADSYYPDYTWKVEPLPESGDYVDIIDVDNANSTLTLNVSGWEVDGWPYYINKLAYAKTARAADRTLIIPYTGEPGDDFYVLVQKNNKDGVVTSHHPYTIPQEIKSATTITADQNRSLFVKGATLTVDANLSARNIYVGPDAKLTINSGKTLTADSVFLRTTADKAAELKNQGTIAAATKVLYTRIVKSKDGYCQFGLPLTCLGNANSVRLSNGAESKYKTGSGWVLRYYDEPYRAAHGIGVDGANWRTLDGVGTIQGGKGYEMYSGVNYYREYYFPVDITALTNEVAVTHTDGDPNDAGWNVIVSPLTHSMVNNPVPEGLVVSWMLPDGSFEQEIPTVIPPAKTFAYQAATSGTLSFAGTSIAQPSPRRVTAQEEQDRIQWIHLDITDANGLGDQTGIYSHPDRYEQSYQTGIDVAKQSLTAARAMLYTSHAYGEMAFAGVADSLLEQGVALTVYSPAAQELTISMRDNDWLNRMDHVWLVDHALGNRTDLLVGDYAFEAAAGTSAGRFTIQGGFRAPLVTTGVEPTSDSFPQGRENACKFIREGKMYIVVNGQLYDVMGRLAQ